MKRFIFYIVLFLFVAEASMDFINLMTDNTELAEMSIETEEDGEENEEKFEKEEIKHNSENIDYVYINNIRIASIHSKDKIAIYEAISIGVIVPPPDNNYCLFG